MPKMDILVCLAPASCPTLDRSTIHQNLNHGNIALEIACIHVGLRKFVRCDRGIPLCGFQATVSQSLQPASHSARNTNTKQTPRNLIRTTATQNSSCPVFQLLAYSSLKSRTGSCRDSVGAYCDPQSANVPIKCNTARPNEVSSVYSTCRRRPLRSDRTTIPSSTISRRCWVSIFFEASGNNLRS
jgi:hypothetical protein